MKNPAHRASASERVVLNSKDSSTTDVVLNSKDSSTTDVAAGFSLRLTGRQRTLKGAAILIEGLSLSAQALRFLDILLDEPAFLLLPPFLSINLLSSSGGGKRKTP